MFTNERAKLSDFLSAIGATLDIPDYVYEDATLKYEDVGAWLGAEDSKLRGFSPEIYPQGSFRLGTVVRPISERDDYDIDLVCRLELDKEQTTQKNLKQIVGERLRERGDLAKILEPMRRCWRLDYPSEDSSPHFHMDVLPSIPNQERLPTGILLTDKELVRWQKSNPKAYAEWFFGRMRAIFEEGKAFVAKSLEASVEDVPDWQVKTPLQRVIQILKRHRDVFFQDNVENKPVSIILTTLAARAYDNQPGVYDALTSIVQGMPYNIEKRNDKWWWVVNPVDPDENFADKWNEYPERREAFFRWLQKAQSDITTMGQSQTLREVATLLIPALGQQPVTKAASDMGLNLSSYSLASAKPRISVPALGDIQHCQTPTWSTQLRYKAGVKGSVHNIHGKKLWGLTNRPVPKKVRLKFVVTTNTPRPYKVKWQVVNTGKEAAEAKQLRGDFYESEESDLHVRWESTLYYGTHWIEAFIIKDEICVAKALAENNLTISFE